jgi:hypothetical protein
MEQYIRSADLTTVTKKSARKETMDHFCKTVSDEAMAWWAGKKQFLNAAIEEAISHV